MVTTTELPDHTKTRTTLTNTVWAVYTGRVSFEKTTWAKFLTGPWDLDPGPKDQRKASLLSFNKGLLFLKEPSTNLWSLDLYLKAAVVIQNLTLPVSLVESKFIAIIFVQLLILPPFTFKCVPVWKVSYVATAHYRNMLFLLLGKNMFPK